MFRRKTSKNLSKMDKIVTGVIIGSAVASIFGLSKTKKGQEITRETGTKINSGVNLIGKVLVGTLRLFSKKKK